MCFSLIVDRYGWNLCVLKFYVVFVIGKWNVILLFFRCIGEPGSMDSFLDYGWWLSKTDKHVVLCISDFPWKPNEVWCGMSHIVGTVIKIVEVRSSSEDGLCEIIMCASKQNPSLNYLLKQCNIMRFVDLTPTK